MTVATKARIDFETSRIGNDLLKQTLDRVTRADLVGGNDVQLLADAGENYPAWLESIEAATDRIFFETYIIHEDEQGQLFGEALIKKAKEGVDVKILYDW